MKCMLFLIHVGNKMSANVPNVGEGEECEKIATTSLERNLVIYKFSFIFIYLWETHRNVYMVIWTMMMSAILFETTNIWKHSTCPLIRDGEIIVVYTYDRIVHSS